MLSSSDYNKLCRIRELAVLRSGKSAVLVSVEPVDNSQPIVSSSLKSTTDVSINRQELDEELYKYSIDRKCNIEEMRKDQLADSSLTPVFAEVNQGLSDYFVNPVDELLYHREIIRGLPVSQLVVPTTRRKDVMRLAHNSV